MLELKNIHKSYKMGDVEQKVLKGIDIKFRDNEFASILGTSGSGKTTLLNIIGGLDKYDSGELIIDGVSTKEYKSRDWDTYRNYRVGFIFQSYNLIMHQTILSNVEMALTLSGVSKQERKKRATEALIKVGLKDHINKRPNQLSGGQMQRVAIARALVNNPEIILADEPTGALDSKTSVQIMDLLKEIAKDKLVIMVTHNPDLAKEYSTRIIELKDGVVISDNNPCKKEKEEVKERKTSRTSMSLFTSLSLSFNNLLTKKGRTFLTAFAGSIGIIGIALILSLSNGVSNYIKDFERKSLTDYPIQIERNSLDYSKVLSMVSNSDTKKCEKGKLCSKDDIITQGSIMSSRGAYTKNNLEEFKKYIEGSKEFKKYADLVSYDYALDLNVYTTDYVKVNPSDLLDAQANSVFVEIPEKKELVKKFKVLAGTMPKDKDEIVLVLDKNKTLPDSLLYSLNMKDRSNIMTDMEKVAIDKNYKVKSTTYSYEDFIGKTYKLILNTDFYKEENGSFIDYSNDSNYMKEVIDNGLELKIVGVVTYEDITQTSIGYTHDLKLYLVDEISKTSLYEAQVNNTTTNVLTGQKFNGVNNTYDELVKKLGIYPKDNPSAINIYPKNFNSKEKIVSLIKKYNKEKKKENRKDLVISYSDVMKTLLSSITTIINMVSIVLISLGAISLVVSSIMIGIITYISVLERTKEIGILRAIGASKKDIRRVFRAETIIEGFAAGLMGIIIALILILPINLIVGALADIDGIASMSPISAILLIALSVLLNVIAGSKPARMASKKDPVEALRTE